jgi:hypothetical protein
MLLTSCHALRDQFDTNTTVDVSGVQPSLEQLNIRSDSQAQQTLVDDLVGKAGLYDKDKKLETLSAGDTRWQYVAEAGFYEVGRQCDQYMTLLFRFNRNQRALRQGLTAANVNNAASGLDSVSSTDPALSRKAATLGIPSIILKTPP